MVAKENLRIRLSPELKQRFDEVIARKKISQQDAIEHLIEWACGQDDLLLSMLFGQVAPANNAELVRIVNARLVEAGANEEGIKVYGTLNRKRRDESRS